MNDERPPPPFQRAPKSYEELTDELVRMEQWLWDVLMTIHHARVVTQMLVEMQRDLKKDPDQDT